MVVPERDAIDASGRLSSNADLHRRVPADGFILASLRRRFCSIVVPDDLAPALQREQARVAPGTVEYFADLPEGEVDAIQRLGELLD
jgi:hypothetical protein